MNFSDFFSKACPGRRPYPYQFEFAGRDSLPDLINVPTGVGKTATTILGWLYRRRHAEKSIRESTPRRLVYCLPMRTLVEQTRDCAIRWLDRLGEFAGTVVYEEGDCSLIKSYSLDLTTTNGVGVHVLMGGADDSNWDEHPERDSLLIGTQDMLLSRALNRGYGMSRYRWPMHFGLLNNDCLWVMDETQLMGVGLTTTAQLQGLRSKLATYGPARSVWMSATLDTSPIRTVDHQEPETGFARHTLTDADREHEPVRKRLVATKALEKSTIILSTEGEKRTYAKELANAVREAHRAGTLTLVVMNRVARAQGVFNELQNLTKSKAKPVPLLADLALIHARFRPRDRKSHEQALFATTIPPAGRIVVATQAIEAGVDVSAATLFTELAPWPCLVQRFGRCNRSGEFNDARVVWIDAVVKDDRDKIAAPYEAAEFDRSRQYLMSLDDVGPIALEAINDERPMPVVHTLRRKDLLDLWDTTPDLAGNDLDVSRFIREGDDTDIQFFWRDLAAEAPPDSFPAAHRSELCSVAVWRAREFLGKLKKTGRHFALVFKPLERSVKWQPIEPDEVRPGMVLLLAPKMGGYLDSVGWTGDPLDCPTPHPPAGGTSNEDMNDGTNLKAARWTSLTQHLDDVALAASNLRIGFSDSVPDIPWDAILTAARWHDVGKAHPAFQNMLLRNVTAEVSQRSTLWAKSDGAQAGRPRYFADEAEQHERICFRHELASALVWLAHSRASQNADLIAFLIASHHGKVRGSIRSLPNEIAPPDPSIRFARGVWQGDILPSVNLGNGETTTPTPLDLTLMELGESASGPSWLTRVINLRDDEEFGPFRISFLETLLRVTDWRGSNAGENKND